MSRAAWALTALFLTNLAAILAVWYGGIDRAELATPAGAVNATGRVMALVGTYLILVQLVLRTHVPWLVTAFGKDPLKRVHTWNGYLAVVLIAAHVVLQTLGYALQERLALLAEITVMLTQYEGMILALAGFLALCGLTLLALDVVRHRIAWTTWRALHLYTYAAVALGLPHIVATGTDFIDPAPAAYWVALQLAIVAMILIVRIPPLWRGATASGRPHPAVVALGGLIVASYLVGAVRLSPASAIITLPPGVRAISPPSSTSVPERASPSPPLVGASLLVQGDEIDTPYGTVQVRLVLVSGQIADVEPLLFPSATKRSRTISLSVEPWLRRRAIAAQSADFDVLSGATYTSRAYQASVVSALRAAGIAGQ